MTPELDFPDATIVEVFAEQVRLRGDAVAVRQWDRSLTYREVAAMAAGVADRLGALGVGRGDLVGVCHDRTPELLPAVLGVLAAGAGYVPLDPTQPVDRLTTVLTDADVSALVVDQVGREMLSAAGRRFVTVEPGAERALASGPARPEDPAYVMYTSGSTGTPKGVVVPHRAVVSLVTTTDPAIGSGPGAVELAFASIGFDVSVTDMFAPLCNGGTIALVGARDRVDAGRLQRFLRAHAVTRAILPVALLPLLDPDDLPDLHWLITGADTPGPEQVGRWAPEGSARRFVHFYGPTETTVNACGFVTSGDWDVPVPIGTPIANVRVHVVDESLRPVPDGVDGELVIGGAGVAHGYLNAPGLTAQRFVADPFGPPGGRLYRTGDRVRRQPDGQLLFLGRNDRQVKVRGQRIEIGEVEARLRAHPSVAHCVVEAVPGAAGPELVAFVTPATADPALLRDHCAQRLTAVMVPARILVLDSLPLNASSKVDRAALHALAAARAADADRPLRPPTTPIARAVASAWSRLLDIGGTDLDDDFFACGGHSVTAMRLVAELTSELGRDVGVEDVLAGRTIEGIAARVEHAPPVERADHPAPPALSAAQRRLWFLDRYALGSGAAYNIAFAERVRGGLDVDALRVALRMVETRQQVLRWRFPDTDGEPTVEVAPPGDVPLPVRTITEDELPAALAADAGAAFDLAEGPLWRVQLYRLGHDDAVLSFVAHHAVFDGWSQDLFYGDLARCYELAIAGRTDVPALPATFAHYVAWRDRRARRRGETDLAWWVDHLAGAPTVLELPKDRPRPEEPRFRGAIARGWLDADTTAAVHRAARADATTASAVLLAALGLLLSRLTGRDDLLVGTPAVDRRHPDFQEMVGFFVEIIPLRLRRRADGAIRAAAAELVDALAHPEAPLERLVDALGVGGRADRNPVVQVLFNMYNFTAPVLGLAGCAVEPVPNAVPGSPFDLTVYGIEVDDRIRIEFVYDTDLFDADRMDALLAAYLGVVGALLANPAISAAEVPVPDEPRLLATVAERQTARRAATGPAEPSTPTERLIAEVWREVLAVPVVRATDSFFEVGGSSLKAVAVQQRLDRELPSPIRVIDLFRYPTIRSLADHVDGAPSADDAVAAAARRGAARARRARTRPSIRSASE